MTFIGLAIILSSYMFYVYDFEKPSLWIALYSVLTKNIWGAFGAILMFAFVGDKKCKYNEKKTYIKHTKVYIFPAFIARIFQNPMFAPAGRLVYCIYLCHFSIARWLAGDTRMPIYISFVNLLHATISVFVLSIIASLFLCVCLEFPMTALMKELMTLDKRQSEKSKKENFTVNQEQDENVL